MTLWSWWMLAFRTDGTTGDNFAGKGSLYIDITNAGVLYIQTSLHYEQPDLEIGYSEPSLNVDP
jgi:hypothetical protein